MSPDERMTWLLIQPEALSPCVSKSLSRPTEIPENHNFAQACVTSEILRDVKRGERVSSRVLLFTATRPFRSGKAKSE